MPSAWAASKTARFGRGSIYEASVGPKPHRSRTQAVGVAEPSPHAPKARQGKARPTTGAGPGTAGVVGPRRQQAGVLQHAAPVLDTIDSVELILEHTNLFQQRIAASVCSAWSCAVKGLRRHESPATLPGVLQCVSASNLPTPKSPWTHSLTLTCAIWIVCLRLCPQASDGCAPHIQYSRPCCARMLGLVCGGANRAARVARRGGRRARAT